MTTPTRINSSKAPGAIGPYSHALAGANLIFTSGQLPIDPVTKTMPEGVGEQTAVSLNNLRNVLQAGGSDFGNVLKTTVFLADMKDFAAMNEVYATFFGEPFPARSCFAVKELPLGAKVEIEAIALVGVG